MDVSALDKSELANYLQAALSMSPLMMGMINPPFSIIQGKFSEFLTWQHLGVAESPIIKIQSLEASTFRTLTEFLQGKPEATDVVDRADRLLLGDAQVRDGGYAHSFEAAFRDVPSGVAAVLLPVIPEFEVPGSVYTTLFPPRHETHALQSQQVLFIHHSRKTDYLVEPIVDIIHEGPLAYLHLKVAIARSPSQHRIQVSKYTIV